MGLGLYYLWNIAEKVNTKNSITFSIEFTDALPSKKKLTFTDQGNFAFLK